MMERRLASVLPVVAMLVVAACADKRVEPLLTAPKTPEPTEAVHSTTPANCVPGAPNTNPPRGTTASPITLEDTRLKFQMTAADDDPCDSFTFRIELVPGGGFLFQVAPDGTVGTDFMHGGDVVTNPDGWLVYAPFTNQNGTPIGVMTYKVTDAAGNTSPTHYLDVNVTPVNDAPVAVEATHTGFNYIDVTDVTLNLQDVEVGSYVDICILDLPRDGILYWTVAIPGNEVRKGDCRFGETSLKYAAKFTTTACQLVPTSFFPKADSFTWKGFDGQLSSNIATDWVEIVHVNTPPMLAGTQTMTTLEDQSVDFRLTTFDPEGDRASYRIMGLPANGTLRVGGLPITSAPYHIPLVLGPTPTVTYTPKKDFVTQPGIRDRFLVQVTDATTGVTRNCNFEVGALVNAVNDAPTVAGPTSLSATRVGGGQVVPAQTSDIRIADDARVNDQLTLTLRAQGAAAERLDLVNPTGLTWQRVSPMEIKASGTLAQINTALGRGVSWTPNSGTAEVGELVVIVNDNGSYGTTNTGSLIGTMTILVNVADDIQLMRVGRP